MKERRQFVRLDINVVINWNKGDAIPDQTASVDLTKNISVGGICLIAYEKVAVGDVLDLTIDLPTRNTVSAKGKVMWVNEFELVGSESTQRYDVGVQFIQVREQDMQEISKFIFKFINVV